MAPRRDRTSSRPSARPLGNLRHRRGKPLPRAPPQRRSLETLPARPPRSSRLSPRSQVPSRHDPRRRSVPRRAARPRPCGAIRPARSSPPRSRTSPRRPGCRRSPHRRCRRGRGVTRESPRRSRIRSAAASAPKRWASVARALLCATIDVDHLLDCPRARRVQLRRLLPLAPRLGRRPRGALGAALRLGRRGPPRRARRRRVAEGLDRLLRLRRGGVHPPEDRELPRPRLPAGPARDRGRLRRLHRSHGGARAGGGRRPRDRPRALAARREARRPLEARARARRATSSSSPTRT